MKTFCYSSPESSNIVTPIKDAIAPILPTSNDYDRATHLESIRNDIKSVEIVQGEKRLQFLSDDNQPPKVMILDSMVDVPAVDNEGWKESDVMCAKQAHVTSPVSALQLFQMNEQCTDIPTWLRTDGVNEQIHLNKVTNSSKTCLSHALCTNMDGNKINDIHCIESIYTIPTSIKKNSLMTYDTHRQSNKYFQDNPPMININGYEDPYTMNSYYNFVDKQLDNDLPVFCSTSHHTDMKNCCTQETNFFNDQNESVNKYYWKDLPILQWKLNATTAVGIY